MRFKKIIKPIAFLGIFFIILSALSPFFAQKTTENVIELEPKNTIDYLIIGDSEAYTSISPMEIWNKYGFKGYNLGIPAQRLQDTYYSLKKTLKNQTPKVVVLETNAIYRTFNKTEEINKILRSIFKDKFKIYGNHNKWKDFNSTTKKSNHDKLDYSQASTLRGFLYYAEINPYTKGSYVKETNEIAEIPQVPMYYLNKIVEICRKNNIQLICYTVPSPVNWNYEKYNGVREFTEKNKLPLLDFNFKIEELGINWEKDTFDKGDHLNFFGAKKLTNYIGNYLSENTKLIDHRKDEKYSFWNDIWKEYLKITNKN